MFDYTDCVSSGQNDKRGDDLILCWVQVMTMTLTRRLRRSCRPAWTT